MELSKIKEILKKELPLTNIKFEEPMNLHTSFKIGGIKMTKILYYNLYINTICIGKYFANCNN